MTCNAYIDRERHLLVFRSPKCGRTTVSRWFVESVLHKTVDFRSEKCFIGVWLDRHGHYLRHHDAYPLSGGLRYPSFDHVIRLEHLDGDFIPVTASLQLDPPGPGSRNRTKYPEDSSETAAFLGDHLTSQLLAERAAVRARHLYDAELLAAVDDLYAGDYARLPYSGAVV